MHAGHAGETPVKMLTPSAKQTHRSYVWAYATSQLLLKVDIPDSVRDAGQRTVIFRYHWLRAKGSMLVKLAPNTFEQRV